MAAVTLLDIAERCNLSRASISLVVRDSPRVSAETKVRVRAAMEEMGYVYDRRAANLRASRTFGIGVVLTDVHNPGLADLAMAIEDGAADGDCSVMMGYSRDVVGRQTDVIRAMLEYRLDGIIVSPAHRSVPGDFTQLAASGVPVVQVTRRVKGLVSGYSGPNNEMAGSLLATHLHELGARTVAFVGGNHGVSARTERVRGLREQWRRLGGTWKPELIIATNALASGGAIGARELLAEGPSGLPDAIVAYSDTVAAGVVSELRSCGIESGSDVAIAGINDSPTAMHLHPTLTSVDTQMTTVGREAVRMLFDAIETPEFEPVAAVTDCAIRIRESTTRWAPRSRR